MVKPLPHHRIYRKPDYPPVLGKITRTIGIFFLGPGFVITVVLILLAYHESQYRNKIYPNVTIAGIPFGGKTQVEVRAYWEKKSRPFAETILEFKADGRVATLSGTELKLGYDAGLAATQAFLIGRSGNIFSMMVQRFFSERIDITPLFTYETGLFDQMLEMIGYSIYIPAQEALFAFSEGRVAEFRPSKSGRKLDTARAKNEFTAFLATLPDRSQNNRSYIIELPVVTVDPEITTDRVNDLGIRETVGKGYSEFSGSIAGRIHNVALAASRLNGVLIAPDEIFSFNRTLGDISLATGYRQAYIIQNGRTVLGDGGGVCQVSTTIFRAALNAGLPVLERHPHAYRVHYYEEGGFKAGLDATVFDPTADLKIKNDTGHHLLIQTKTDTKKLTLEIELYGTSDGRTAEITDHQVWGVTPPPEPLYQDDPTLPSGQVKQIDWASWGAKANFRYLVRRNGETLIDTAFFSNYRPWQAIYLKGVGPN